MAFRRTKAVAKRVLGADEDMGRASWSFGEYGTTGVVEAFRTSTGEMRLTGQTGGAISVSFDELALEAVDSVMRVVAEHMKAEIQKQQSEQSRQSRANGKSSPDEFERAA